MKISRDLDKFLNERIRKLMKLDQIKQGKVKVGWDMNQDKVYWAERTKDGWVLRSGVKWPHDIATPRELDVDLGVYSASLSGIISWRGEATD